MAALSDLQLERASKASSISGYAWYVLGVLTLTNIVGAIDRFMMGILVVPLKDALLLSDTQLGVLQGVAFAILYSVAGLPCGRLADRVDRRLMISLGCLAWTLATAACAFATSFETLFIARLFVGLGEATLVPAALSLLGAYFPRDRLGLSTALFVGGASFGKSAAFIGGGALLALFGASGGLALLGRHFAPWQALFILAALPGFVTTFLTATLREPSRLTPSVSGGRVVDLAHLVWSRRAAFGTYVAAAICVVSVAHILAAWAPSFFVRRFSLEIGAAATWVGVVAVIVSPIGAFIGGQVTDALSRGGSRTGALTVIITALFLLAPGAVVTFVVSDNLIVAAVCYGLIQAVVLASGPQCFAGLQAMTPIEHRGLATATFLAMTTLVALGLGVTLIGVISDHLFAGGENALGRSLAAAICVLAALGIGLGLVARSAVVRIQPV